MMQSITPQSTTSTTEATSFDGKLSKTEIINLLEGQFKNDREAENGTPSGNYYWYRKRKEITTLLANNIEILLKNKKPGEKIRFVDIGCGCGIDLFVLRDCAQQFSPDFEFIGLDGAPMSLDICKLKKEYYGVENLELHMADLTGDLMFADDSVDMIYCSEVVEHLIQPEKLFQEMHRVLKPNGLLMLTTPNEPNPLQRTYWDKKRRKRALAKIEELRKVPQIVYFEGKEVALYGHITCRTNREWDNAIESEGLRLLDYGRGGIIYGATTLADRELTLGVRFLVEAVLDFLPKSWTRNLSNQLIGLYQVKG